MWGCLRNVMQEGGPTIDHTKSPAIAGLFHCIATVKAYTCRLSNSFACQRNPD